VTVQLTGSTAHACCHCGARATADAHFCSGCRKILTLSRSTDYFAFLGVPRRLNLDLVDLERRFRALSRQFHPDYFYHATPAERRASLERSSYLNDAFRTLKQPAGRVEYLLDIEGLALGDKDDASRRVPPALLEEVFALNERLDEVREMRGSGASERGIRDCLQAAREPIERKCDEHERQLTLLSARWDELSESAGAARDDERRAVLAALRGLMLEANYIRNLLAGIEKELASQG